VRSIPTGTETGQFLAVDLGGSNCRICLVELRGDSTFNVIQSKHSVPSHVMVNASYRPLFDFITQKMSAFLEQHPGSYSLGFTFSFTCEQTSLAGGRLIRWDKSWDIPEAIGRDPCVLLQEAIDRRGFPVQVTVLANDSVGTLLTRSYTSGPETSTLAAIIFGTGTNAAYVEKLSNVKKLSNVRRLGTWNDSIMVINTEWGSLDDEMAVLPRTSFDDELDEASIDPGSQMLEKRVSGLYLGELLRLAIRRLDQLRVLDMTFKEKTCRDGIDSSFLSKLAASNADSAVRLIRDTLSADNVSEDDAKAIQLVSKSIARRAARLAGASLAALIIQSGRLRKPSKSLDIERFWQKIRLIWNKVLSFLGLWLGKPLSIQQQKASQTYRENIDIAADGSLIEFYPTFEAEMRAAMREVPEVGPAGEQRIRISLAKDGSGVGAALMAQAASTTAPVLK